MEFSRPEYLSGQPFPSPGDLPNPGIKPGSPTLQADSLPAELSGKPKVRECVSCSVVSHFLQPHGLQPARLLCLWDSPGKNTGAGCHFLLQRIFPTQGSNLGLPLRHWQQILYHQYHPGSPLNKPRKAPSLYPPNFSGAQQMLLKLQVGILYYKSLALCFHYI